MKSPFGMALRQTTGFVESLLQLIGLAWVAPDFSTLCRRQKALAVDIPYRGSPGPLHLLIDNEALSTIGPRTMPNGIKAEGEGEWQARKHGGPKRRPWRKIHLGIDEDTLELRAVEITGSHVGDAPMLPELLDQIPGNQDIGSVTADGAYDTRKCHDAVADRGAHAVIPPRRTRSLGRPAPPGRSPATKRSGRQSIWAAPSGAIGADITAEAASRRRCTVRSCWAKASWPGTAIVRSPSSRSASPCSTASPGIPVTEAVG